MGIGCLGVMVNIFKSSDVASGYVCDRLEARSFAILAFRSLLAQADLAVHRAAVAA
jgi:hypothetical protein